MKSISNNKCNYSEKLYFFYLIVLGLYLLPVAVNAQVYKHLDQFTQNKYFASFINGKGGLKDTILEKQGLRINYYFEKGDNSSFTIIRNYDKGTQDYSFLPDKLILTIYGGNKADQIRLRLWEDININGKFDSTDEVYASDFHQLYDTGLYSIPFPFHSFKRIEGDGNQKLDLNRIRAWEIEVKSDKGDTHSGILYLRDLRFYSHYQPKESEKAALTGTFITLSKTDSGKNGYWTQQDWNNELMRMKHMNLQKLIIQYSIHQNQAWYFPSNLTFIKYQEAAINKIFKAAEEAGIKVYLGLFFDESWYKSDKALESTYNTLLIKNKENIDELFRLFGSSTAFGGWYIPQELNDYDWQTQNKKDLLFSWLQQVAEYAHKNDASKPVIIAPYFNLWQPADLIEAWYNELFNVAKDIDWVYPQDGIGTSLKEVHIDIPNFCGHIKSACVKHGKKFGVTVESFRQHTGWPIDNGIFSATPTDINQLNEQIQEAYQLKPNDIINFEWDYLVKMDN